MYIYIYIYIHIHNAIYENWSVLGYAGVLLSTVSSFLIVLKTPYAANCSGPIVPAIAPNCSGNCTQLSRKSVANCPGQLLAGQIIYSFFNVPCSLKAWKIHAYGMCGCKAHACMLESICMHMQACIHACNACLLACLPACLLACLCGATGGQGRPKTTQSRGI